MNTSFFEVVQRHHLSRERIEMVKEILLAEAEGKKVAVLIPRKAGVTYMKRVMDDMREALKLKNPGTEFIHTVPKKPNTVEIISFD